MFAPTHKLIAFGNSKPTLYGSAQTAWKRRLYMVPFQQKFDRVADPARNVLLEDRELLDKLRPEAPGVLRKLIQGGMERLRNGLRPPATVTDAATAYLVEQNLISTWMEERCDTADPSARTPANALWPDFVNWCEDNHCPAGYRTAFNERLANSGIQIKKTETVRGVCVGIRLKDSGGADD